MMPTDALSQVNYGHTRHCEIAMRFACVNKQRKVKGNFGTSEGLMCTLSGRWAPPPPFTFQNAPTRLARNVLLHKTCDSSILTNSSSRHFAWSVWLLWSLHNEKFLRNYYIWGVTCNQVRLAKMAECLQQISKSHLVSLDFEVEMHSSKIVVKTVLWSFAQFELRITFSLTQWELTKLRQYKLTDIKMQTPNSLRFSQCSVRNRILVD